MAIRDSYAIGIGVGRVGRPGDFPLLEGARADARRFCDWAERQGYATTPIIDSSTSKVSFQQICDAVDAILENKVARLLIYFSGHGTALAEGDYWLLSDFPDRGGECINEALTTRTARDHPIGQFAIIADACRSTIPQAARVSGGNLFGTPRIDVVIQPKVDSFYATRTGAIAQEVNDGDPTKAFGVFSKCLFSALNGTEPDALAPGRAPPLVSSQSLADWLETAVPLESGKIPGGKVQRPSVAHGWNVPNDVYWSGDAAPPTIAAPAAPVGAAAAPPMPAPLPGAGGGLGDLLGLGLGPNTALPGGLGGLLTGLVGSISFDTVKDVLLPGFLRRRSPAPAEPPPAGKIANRPSADDQAEAAARVRVEAQDNAQHAYVAQATAAICAANGRESFETAMGMTIVGAKVVQVVTRPALRPPEFFTETAGSDEWQIRCFDVPQPLVIELDDGRWIGTAAMPDFIGTMLVDTGAVLSLNYAVSRSSSRWDDRFALAYAAGTVAAARWAALLNVGARASPAELHAFASRIRLGNHANPTLGILAAYSCDQGRFVGGSDSGGFDSVDNIASLFATENHFVPYDVAYLAHDKLLLTEPMVFAGPPAATAWVAGAFPLMTQGWALLAAGQPEVDARLLDLKSGLLPGLWTCLRAEEGKQLAELVKSGGL